MTRTLNQVESDILDNIEDGWHSGVHDNVVELLEIANAQAELIGELKKLVALLQNNKKEGCKTW